MSQLYCYFFHLLLKIRHLFSKNSRNIINILLAIGVYNLIVYILILLLFIIFIFIIKFKEHNFSRFFFANDIACYLSSLSIINYIFLNLGSKYVAICNIL